eukprot:SAG22_NODE_436_length_10519_cov_21.912188_3_plen_83_part_00
MITAFKREGSGPASSSACSCSTSADFRRSAAVLSLAWRSMAPAASAATDATSSRSCDTCCSAAAARASATCAIRPSRKHRAV